MVLNFFLFFLDISKIKIYNKKTSFILQRVETRHLQHFYNKSQVISCYWFKFETNTKITFLPQQ